MMKVCQERQTVIVKSSAEIQLPSQEKSLALMLAWLTTDTAAVSMQGLTCAFAEGTLRDLISILNMNSSALVIPFVVFILLSHSLTL